VATSLAEAAGSRAFPWSLAEAEAAVQGWVLPLWAATVVVLLAHPALRYAEPAGRGQARWVLVGALPWALYILTSTFAPAGLLPPWFDMVQNFALLCIPLAVFAVLARETAAQERVLLELTQEVQRTSSLTELSQLVGKDLQIAFHPRVAYVFYRDQATQRLALGHSSGIARRGEVPAEFELVRVAEREARPLDFPRDLSGIVGPEERAWLEALQARLVVPIHGQGKRLVGLLVLGAKKSGEPYTAHDRRLLASLAGQIGLVYENALLKRDVYLGRKTQREVLDRLEARDVNLVKECPRCGACYDSTAAACPTDGSELVLPAAVERTIDGRYRLDRLLGRGGMGGVYEAMDLREGRRVAVKVLLASLFGEHDVLRRFEREARVSSRLNHPNIVTVYDYGTTATGGAFLTMELLEGSTLRALFQRGAVDRASLPSWCDQICAGLAEAHRAGVIHRDLKPGNVFLAGMNGDPPIIKLVDFGLAKVRDPGLDDLTSLTETGALLGTLTYMSPEQLSGDEVDERTDIFALGVLVVEALTGKPPFAGGTPAELIAAIYRSSFTLPPDGAATRRLERVLRACLAREPSDRYRTVPEAARDLTRALREYAEDVA
jgi:eukaryotic-like serine/threonine-protein kinase